MKNILIFGGTGFIGRHLVNQIKDDYLLTILSRNPEKYTGTLPKEVRLEKIDYANPESLIHLFDEADAIINLAGENVGTRWTKKKIQSIKQSRLKADQVIVFAFGACSKKPETIIQGSGMGVYGFNPTDDSFSEESPLGSQGFLTDVGIAHEKAFHDLEQKTRVVYLRTGLVLDGKEGALPQMAMSFSLIAGGPMGSGNQWNSWIHIRDEVRAIRFLMENEKCRGPYNLTAPHPVQNRDFAKMLGKALHRPSFVSTPAFFLKLVMGAMANELLLKGLKILPKRLQEEGFRFQFEQLEDAFRDIYR